MADERNNVNREYKDRLFKLVFREKEDLLQFYGVCSISRICTEKGWRGMTEIFTAAGRFSCLFRSL